MCGIHHANPFSHPLVLQSIFSAYGSILTEKTISLDKTGSTGLESPINSSWCVRLQWGSSLKNIMEWRLISLFHEYFHIGVDKIWTRKKKESEIANSANLALNKGFCVSLCATSVAMDILTLSLSTILFILWEENFLPKYLDWGWTRWQNCES